MSEQMTLGLGVVEEVVVEEEPTAPKKPLCKLYIYVVKPEAVGTDTEGDAENQFPLSIIMYLWKAKVLVAALRAAGVKCGYNMSWKGAKIATKPQRSMAFADMRRRLAKVGLNMPF